ncbi:MAG TPA: DUF4412 domain-containing protein [Pyrinomonadaceae bacterium]|nr:DUF4412 domain-containing protein [Pyrinomonadaceae bacterium]
MQKEMNRRNLISCFVILVFLCGCATAQTTASSEDADSLRMMLSNQPDYTATQRFVFSEGFGGFGANSKVAKMGKRHAEITEDTIFINEPGKPLIKIFPKRKQYSELQLPKTDEVAVSPEELARQVNTTFRSLGTERIAEYTCIKIEVVYKDEKLNEIKYLFWAAPALKNLVIQSETSLGPRVKFLMLLENVSLGVNEELFRIPAGYKKVAEPDYFKQLEEDIRKPL